MIPEFRAAVLGLGGIGSAALYRLARRLGGDVVGFERFDLGHHHGASEDHSRIIRRSYHTPAYVRLAGRAFEAWEEVERESGEGLVIRTGGLDLWPEGAAIDPTDYTESMRAEDVGFEELDAHEVMRRWPQWRLDPGTRGVFQEDGGVVLASRANRVHRDLAVACGAQVRERSPVTAIRDAGGELDLEAGESRCRVSSLIVAADAWTNDVLGMLDVPPLALTITQEHVVYLDREADGFGAERFPAWIWMDDPSFYGVPAMDGLGPKLGQDVGGPEIGHPDRRGRAKPDAVGPVLAFASQRLPRASRRTIRIRPCTYAMPPDRDFVLDRVPGHPSVLVALGAAHGFKFAAWFGGALTELALGGTPTDDLAPFGIDRPVLHLKNPPRRFLV